MKSIATYAPTFFGYNNSVLAIVGQEFHSVVDHFIDKKRDGNKYNITLTVQTVCTAQKLSQIVVLLDKVVVLKVAKWQIKAEITMF